MTVPLEFGKLYHIYNHGVGGRDIFRNADNHEYFLSLYDKFIGPVADTFAWVLMKNHFHFLIRCKEKHEIAENISHIIAQDKSSETHLNGLTPEIQLDSKIFSKQFSKFFNAYAQAYNKYYQARGALFERPFKRKIITDERYLKRLIVYIHNNPVHHGFCEHPVEYPWSSYLSCISPGTARIKKEQVISWFNDTTSYKHLHEEKTEIQDLEGWLFNT